MHPQVWWEHDVNIMRISWWSYWWWMVINGNIMGIEATIWREEGPLRFHFFSMGLQYHGMTHHWIHGMTHIFFLLKTDCLSWWIPWKSSWITPRNHWVIGILEDHWCGWKHTWFLVFLLLENRFCFSWWIWKTMGIFRDHHGKIATSSIKNHQVT